MKKNKRGRKTRRRYKHRNSRKQKYSYGGTHDAIPDEKINAVPVKLLFLDVDGVLNYTRCEEEFSTPHLERIFSIVKQTGCKIVISSTYRLSEGSKQRLWNALEKVGIPKKIHSLPDYQQTPWLLDDGLERTDEILDVIKNIEENDRYEITSWAALDDGDLLNQGTIENQKKITTHFILVDAKTGITENDVAKTIDLLNRR